MAHIPYDLITYSLLSLVVVAGAVHMAWRLSRPVPEADRVVIERTLEARGERLLNIRKAWFGGPVSETSRSYSEVGAPYLVTATAANGAPRRYFLATDGWDSHGDPILKQRNDLAWSVISHPRKVHSLFDDPPADEDVSTN